MPFRPCFVSGFVFFLMVLTYAHAREEEERTEDERQISSLKQSTTATENGTATGTKECEV